MSEVGILQGGGGEGQARVWVGQAGGQAGQDGKAEQGGHGRHGGQGGAVW